MNALHPKKLLLTKWTAVQPVARQKHFVVTKVMEPELRGVQVVAEVLAAASATEAAAATTGALSQGARPRKVGGKARPVSTTPKIEWIEIEAVHSGSVRRIPWRELRDTTLWRQGWV